MRTEEHFACNLAMCKTMYTKTQTYMHAYKHTVICLKCISWIFSSKGVLTKVSRYTTWDRSKKQSFPLNEESHRLLKDTIPQVPFREQILRTYENYIKHKNCKTILKRKRKIWIDVSAKMWPELNLTSLCIMKTWLDHLVNI